MKRLLAFGPVLLRAALRLAKHLPVIAMMVICAYGGVAAGFRLAGETSRQLGPIKVRYHIEMESGLTRLQLPPIGRVDFPTHSLPMQFKLAWEEIDAAALGAALDQHGPQAEAARLLELLKSQLPGVGIYFLLFTLLGVALISTSVVFALTMLRGWGRPQALRYLALNLVGGMAWIVMLALGTVLQYNPAAFAEPHSSSNIRKLQQVYGSIEAGAERFADGSEAAEQMFANWLEFADSGQPLPVDDGEVVAVLHVSDLHLPAGIDLAASDFVRMIFKESRYEIDAVIDTGDLTSFSSAAGDLQLISPLSDVSQFVESLEVPYLFVRGNHDARFVTNLVAGTENGVVLDGNSYDLQGLSVYGRGLYRTEAPERSLEDLHDDAESSKYLGIVEDIKPFVEADIVTMSSMPDIVLLHDERLAENLAGQVPLVLSGHTHQHHFEIREGTIFMQAGSTGGAGPSQFSSNEGLPLSAQVLYFEADTGQLIAYDLFERILTGPHAGEQGFDREVINPADTVLPQTEAKPAKTTTP